MSDKYKELREAVERCNGGIANVDDVRALLDERDALEANVVAPTDTDVDEINTLCGKFNAGEIDFLSLVCRLWNSAYHIGTVETLKDRTPESNTNE